MSGAGSGAWSAPEYFGTLCPVRVWFGSGSGGSTAPHDELTMLVISSSHGQARNSFMLKLSYESLSNFL